MISHDLHLVMSATDEVVCLNHRVCCHGKPEQVSDDPAFLELFSALVSDGLAVSTHHHNHEHYISGHVKPQSKNRENQACYNYLLQTSFYWLYARVSGLLASAGCLVVLLYGAGCPFLRYIGSFRFA